LASRLFVGLLSRCAAASTTRVVRNRVASTRSGQRAGRPRRSRQVAAVSSNQRPSGRQRRRARCGRPQLWHLPPARSKRTRALSSRQFGGYSGRRSGRIGMATPPAFCRARGRRWRRRFQAAWRSRQGRAAASRSRRTVAGSCAACGLAQRRPLLEKRPGSWGTFACVAKVTDRGGPRPVLRRAEMRALPRWCRSPPGCGSVVRSPCRCGRVPGSARTTDRPGQAGRGVGPAPPEARPTAAITAPGVHHPWRLIVSCAQPQVAPVFVTGGCAAAVLPGRNTGLGGPTS